MDEVINVGMNRINKTPEAVKATANGSLKGNKKSKHASESVARFIFLICAVVAILAVCSITIYMFIKGTESLKSVGIADLLFKTVWAPTAMVQNHSSAGRWVMSWKHPTRLGGKDRSFFMSVCLNVLEYRCYCSS